MAFVDELRKIQKEIHLTAREKGWWDDLNPNIGEKIALIHSELSEALEHLRQGNPPDDKIPEFTGAEAEMADVIIRLLDLAEFANWDVAGAIERKMEYNKTRSIKHGGKLF